LRTVFDVGSKRERLKELESKLQDPDLWKNQKEAVTLSQDFNHLKEEIDEFDSLKEKIGEVKTEDEFREMGKRLKKKEKEVFLSGKHDKGEAVLSVFAGAGGQDAQDWATMLLRMYERYCQRKRFRFEVLSQSFGEGGGPEGRIGTKSVTAEIKGKFAYGYLKGENGVHRLVRLSPFSSKSLRHTSFSMVEVLPKIKDLSEEGIIVKPEELKIEFYRASGPGGQYVNKRETAVRIRHLPTDVVVSCQSERSQIQNRKRATELLYSKLYDFYKKRHKEKIVKEKGKRVSASWGNQIRSYVLHPYRMVKDLRTGVETSDTDKVLDGQIEDFIESEIKLKDD